MYIGRTHCEVCEDRNGGILLSYNEEDELKHFNYISEAIKFVRHSMKKNGKLVTKVELNGCTLYGAYAIYIEYIFCHR